MKKTNGIIFFRNGNVEPMREKKQKTNIDRLALYAWNWSHKSQQTRGKPYNVFR